MDLDLIDLDDAMDLDLIDLDDAIDLDLIDLDNRYRGSNQYTFRPPHTVASLKSQEHRCVWS